MSDWFKELQAKHDADRRTRHGAVLRAIRKPPSAIVMTDRNGREALAIITAEMSNRSEGTWRASLYWHDGPTGHVTKKTLGTLAAELASDYAPVSVRAISEDATMAWFGTSQFAEGARRVLETQQWNERERKK